MCKKLSELNGTDILLVGEDSVMTKNDVLEDLAFYKSQKYSIYTTKEYHANLDAMEVLDRALENEYQNMYEDWYQNILGDVTKEDIKDIQVVLDRILSRNKKMNITYLEDEEVEIDII